MMMVGSVIRLITSAPTKDDDCAKPAKLIKIARPKMPNTIDGTAARFEMFTSIASVQRFLGANSSR